MTVKSQSFHGISIDHILKMMGTCPGGGGGTRSGKVRVCEAGPPDPLPPSIRTSLKKTPLPFAARRDMYAISGPFQS